MSNHRIDMLENRIKDLEEWVAKLEAQVEKSGPKKGTRRTTKTEASK